MFKRVFIIVLSIMILIGMGGCTEKAETKNSTNQETKKYTMDEKKELALAYLKDKYDEEFEGISYTPKQWGTGGDSFYVRPKNGTNEDGFEVWGIVNKENGIYEFTDGYFGVYIRDEYEKVMRSFIDEFYSHYKIYIKPNIDGSLPERLNKSTKISEIYKKGEKYGFRADVHVYVKESLANGSDIKDAVKKIALKMVENKMVGEIDINIIRDDKYAGIILDKANWQEVSDEENLVKDYNLIINKDLQIIDYRKGE